MSNEELSRVGYIINKNLACDIDDEKGAKLLQSIAEEFNQWFPLYKFSTVICREKVWLTHVVKGYDLLS